jgi:hypothetical protein
MATAKQSIASTIAMIMISKAVMICLFLEKSKNDSKNKKYIVEGG